MSKLLRNTWQLARNDPAAVFFHLGTATGLLGFCMTDPLPLRCCSITSSIASITFLVTRKPFGSMIPIAWSSLFISVNLFKINELLRERKLIELSAQEEEIYTVHFLPSGMRPRQFKRLTAEARKREYPLGTVLQKEGEFPTTVKLLTKGKVRVEIDEEEVYTVNAQEPICFLGDLNLLEKVDFSKKKKKKGEISSKDIHKYTASEIVITPTVTTLEWDLVRYFYSFENCLLIHSNRII